PLGRNITAPRSTAGNGDALECTVQQQTDLGMRISGGQTAFDVHTLVMLQSTVVLHGYGLPRSRLEVMQPHWRTGIYGRFWFRLQWYFGVVLLLQPVLQLIASCARQRCQLGFQVLAGGLQPRQHGVEGVELACIASLDQFPA